jgi:dihydrofolate synthase/folylpolyglutamate synthase
MPEHAHPTFFEAVTAMALRYFQEQRCELVLWETGMGGRLDATNVVTPLVSVITNVQFDHAAYLGETIEKIAAEKAGIIKPGVPVVTAADDGTAMEVIARAAEEAQAPLTRIRPADAEVLNTDLRGQTVSVGGTPFWIPLLGAHQARNTAVAVAVARLALRCSDETIRLGLAATEWPGRFHVLPGKPTLVLDGAHNPAAARALSEALDTHFAGKRVTLVLGILQDKDCAEFCRILAPRASEVLTVRVANDRASDPAELAALCQRLAPQAAVRNAQTLGGALAETHGRDGIVVVTGSLFLVGEALALARGCRLESVLNQ